MTDVYREKFFHALRGPLVFDDVSTNTILDEIALSDVQLIEPVAADLETQARNAERLQVFLEMLARRNGGQP